MYRPGHLDLAVKDKTFAYLGLEGEPFHISCKLPRSCDAALMLPFVKPTGYGLGKSGWVSVEFAPGEVPPLPLIKSWIDESYRAQAPKKLIATLAPAAGHAPPAAKTKRKSAGTSRPERAARPRGALGPC